MQLGEFVRNAKALVEFDRDTVCAFSPVLDSAFCIDRYDDEFGRGIRFAVATWIDGV